MVEQFPGNSNRGREQVGAPPPTQKPADTHKIERVVQGEVVRRKRPLGTRFRESFFGGTSKGLLGAVAMSVLIPAARDMVATAGREMLEGLIYGDSAPRPRGMMGGWTPAGQPSRTRYDAYARPSVGTSPARTQPAQRDISRQARSTHSFDEIYLESRGEAEQVIDVMMETLQEYRQVTLSDLYGLVGISSAYTDQKYGWVDLQGASVQPARGGLYLLNLPRPIVLD